MNELDAIAKEAAIGIRFASSCPSPEKRIRAAIDKALEYALTKEPSDETLLAGYKAYGNERDVEGIVDAHRAMTKQLLETLKGNSSDAQSERSATNKQEG